MYNAWLIYNRSDAKVNKSFIKWFIEEAAILKVNLKLIYRDEVSFEQHNEYHHVKTKLPDFVINRTRDTSIQMHFEKLNIPIFNSRKVSEICNDKLKTYHEMSKINVPFQKTYKITRLIKSIDVPLDYPFVIKPIHGRGGQSVKLIHNASTWKKQKNNFNPKMIAQSTANIQFGKDLRVFVIGKKIIAAVLRINTNDFRANYKLGGKAKLYHLTHDEKSLIMKIIHHFDFDFVGIDFLIDQDNHLVFNEIEDVVGSRILSLTTNINVLNLYLKHILNKITELNA